MVDDIPAWMKNAAARTAVADSALSSNECASNCASRKTDPYEKPYPCDCDPIRALIAHIERAGFIYSYEALFERAKDAINRPAPETTAEVPHMMASLDRIAREDASIETPARRDTGVLDTNGERLLEGDRVRVEWTAELGVTELHCAGVGTVVYMPDKITAAWFVQFDTPFRRSVGPEGLYTSESQMLLQEREIGDECLIHFEKIGAQKTGVPRAGYMGDINGPGCDPDVP